MAVFYVRVPDELADVVRERARASRRSLTQELILLIEQALKAALIEEGSEPL